jgi:hypothetical protein
MKHALIAASKSSNNEHGTGADPEFQVRGAHVKKLFGVFRVKNHDFTPKNHIFSNGSAPMVGNVCPRSKVLLSIRSYFTDMEHVIYQSI